MEDFEYFKEGLDIDIDTLHKCCSNQATLYQEVGEIVSNLRFKVKSVKLNFDGYQAEFDLNIRATPNNYDIEKVTENTIKSVIESSDRTHDTKVEILKLEKELERWSNLLTAYDQRRSMLKAEVELYQANYWGDVSIREDEKMGRKQTEKAIEEGGKKRGKTKEK